MQYSLTLCAIIKWMTVFSVSWEICQNKYNVFTSTNQVFLCPLTYRFYKYKKYWQYVCLPWMIHHVAPYSIHKKMPGIIVPGILFLNIYIKITPLCPRKPLLNRHGS